jgi:ring-1,2-phenylacetyl-CoA epoxidase subunit PaaD
MTVAVSDLKDLVGRVVDPEIPVLTIEDLGVLRDVGVADGTVVVTITPTYSGCPAMGQIEDDIARALERSGHRNFRIETVLSPAWTTEWITGEGHRKLADFGIAPPTSVEAVLCPQCQARDPKMIARFGSTACKALMVCSDCGEPFDYFKVH